MKKVWIVSKVIDDGEDYIETPIRVFSTVEKARTWMDAQGPLDSTCNAFRYYTRQSWDVDSE